MLPRTLYTRSSNCFQRIIHHTGYRINNRLFSTTSFTKTALVTGGNRGIGLEVCKQLSDMGINVIMGTRKLENGVNALEKEFTKEQRDRVTLLQLDISDTYSISDAVKHVESNYDPIDIVVNNAGINLSTSPNSRKMLNETLSTNYYGTVEFTQSILPLMTTQKTSKCPTSSAYFSRIVTVSNRDAALQKVSPELQQRFLKEDLDETELHGIMEQFKKDSLKYIEKGDDAEVDSVIMNEGWLKCPYLMSYIGINMFTRILGQKFVTENDNDHWIAAYCPGHCATDSTDYFGTRDSMEGAFGVTTLSTMLLDNDSIPNGRFCAAFYSNNDLDTIELEVMNWQNPSDTISWDKLCDGNL